MSENGKSFAERLARLEESNKRTENAVTDLTHTVGRLASLVQNQSRPNWSVWIGVIGIVCVLLGGGFAYINASINNQIEPLKIAAEANDQARNLQWAEQSRMNQVLWNASGLGREFYYPQEPYFFPESRNPK